MLSKNIIEKLKNIGLVFIILTSFQAHAQESEGFNTLVWSDEFHGTGMIDTSKWFHQTKLPAHGSWFNNEIQHYTDREENSYVKDGFLHIVARKEKYKNQGISKNYTSARLNSKFAFTYGRVEVYAKLPVGKGTWPAIWTLGKNINEAGAYWETQGFGEVNWPMCGEMDIMEHWGKNQDFVQSAVHNPASYAGKFNNHQGQKLPGVSEDFHLYVLEWKADELVFSVDGKVHYTYSPKKKNKDYWPYTSDHYLLLNVAIENLIDPEFTQSEMVIDYVRVYQ